MELQVEQKDHGISVSPAGKDDGRAAKRQGWVAVIQYGKFAIVQRGRIVSCADVLGADRAQPAIWKDANGLVLVES